jgi:hypothetical protein
MASLPDIGLDIISRSMGVASRLRCSGCGLEHIFLALLQGPESDPSRIALEAAKLTTTEIEALERRASGSEVDDVAQCNPRHYVLVGIARGLALSTGDQLSDLHVLLALVYEGYLVELLGRERAVDIVRSLARLNDSMPKAEVPIVQKMPDFGPRLYFPSALRVQVLEELLELFPPSDGPYWAWNDSVWKPDYCWIDSDIWSGVSDVVRRVVSDESIIEVAMEDAVATERAAYQ